MPGSPAKSLTSTAAGPPDTSLDPSCDAEEGSVVAHWGLDALLTGLAGRPVTAGQPRGDFGDLLEACAP
jgi:hypothetical protein